MKHDIATTLLDDYLDGGLAPPLVEELETHVRQCVTCRGEVEGLRQLLDATAALPRSINPSRDLWTAIADQIQPGGKPHRAPGSRLLQRLGFFSWSWPTALATAAVVGVLFISSFDPLTPPGPEQHAVPAAMSVPADADPHAAALVLALESECLECERELAAYTNTDTMNSGLVTRMLKENMPVVDKAIAEARSAWLASPDEPGLARLLSSAYRAKMALQGRAIRMASET